MTFAGDFRCAAIIVAAGASARMGFDKLAAPLAGKPVLQRTAGAFLEAETISSLVIVGPPERAELLAACPVPAGKSLHYTSGGTSRQESVARGLAEIPAGTRFVAVHDGARPLVTPAEIDRCVRHAISAGATALARRATETMKRSDEANRCTGSVERENLWLMETPQVFPLEILRAAYDAITARGLVITDEVSALEHYGETVRFLESRFPNLKITTPSDLVLAEALVSFSA